jgi:hypothetical protein
MLLLHRPRPTSHFCPPQSSFSTQEQRKWLGIHRGIRCRFTLLLQTPLMGECLGLPCNNPLQTMVQPSIRRDRRCMTAKITPCVVLLPPLQMVGRHHCLGRAFPRPSWLHDPDVERVRIYYHTVISPGHSPFCLCNKCLPAGEARRLGTRNCALTAAVEERVENVCL